ncbi:hypothetical protein PAHAL_2G130400 [Panicum hallii]|uniref:Beta-amylase n=1 Tax=Panicum hallii TaxID=206008 RepID=A0A2T8KNV3_9POAL|nr:hypothetical protein PAHAL_2G130400 [Panicum hallii]
MRTEKPASGLFLSECSQYFQSCDPAPSSCFYCFLQMGIINSHCQLVDPEGVRTELRHLKSLNVDGVIVYCWCGIVEAWIPRKYEWSGYRDLFGIIKEFKLKVQVVLSFHGSGETGSGDVLISLPNWIMEIAKENQDIFFTDCEGRRNT